MLRILELEKKAAEEINKELGAETIRTSLKGDDSTICEVLLHPSCMVVLSAETNSKTMILRNGKAFLLDSVRFYRIDKL